MADVVDGILDLIRTAVGDVPVYAGRVHEDPPGEYVVVYAGEAKREQLSHRNDRSDGRFRWQVTTVGRDEELCRWLANRVRDYLLANRPVVSGWVCQRPLHEYGQLPQFDDPGAGLANDYRVDLYTSRAHRS